MWIHQKSWQVLAAIIITLSTPLPAQQLPTFAIHDSAFYYDGKPIQIHSGEMHYARIPEAYWRHRVQMAKAMGLNTLAVYCFWNFHNTSPGVWDFTSERHNLAKFVTICQEEGMFVMLRPGPYVCAEWEFGGYPWWLQNNLDMVVRNNQAFLDSCNIYIQHLAHELVGLQITHGGPIIMVQVENEFGSFIAQKPDIPIEAHQQYNMAIKNMLTEAGFDVPLFTSDGDWLFDKGAIPGVLTTANGEENIENLKKTIDVYFPGGPYMVAEYYPGWLDHWGEAFIRVDGEQVATQIEKYLQNGISFNIYMVHGGTNFGFTSGANYTDSKGIQPDITSYDYDAPINEHGGVTPKYLAIREVIKRYTDNSLAEIPDPIPVITLPDIILNEKMSLFTCLDTMNPTISEHPLTFEELQQGHGYVLYRKHFTEPFQGILEVEGLRDYALVFVNGERAGELNRMTNTYGLQVDIAANTNLDILVENMGRINYGAQITENTKGIISPVLTDKVELTGDWEMYQLPMTQPPKPDAYSATLRNGTPVIYFGTFVVNQPGDVFLDMQSWGKGIVFVNGKNLGRYWDIGPQQTLYLPGCWLKTGENEVVIFEQQNNDDHKVLRSSPFPVLDKLNVLE